MTHIAPFHDHTSLLFLQELRYLKLLTSRQKYNKINSAVFQSLVSSCLLENYRWNMLQLPQVKFISFFFGHVHIYCINSCCFCRHTAAVLQQPYKWRTLYDTWCWLNNVCIILLMTISDSVNILCMLQKHGDITLWLYRIWYECIMNLYWLLLTSWTSTVEIILHVKMQFLQTDISCCEHLPVPLNFCS